MRCAPPSRVDPAGLAPERAHRARRWCVALAAAALAACGGGSGGSPSSPPADAAAGSDAAIDAAPQPTACQQQHLVCGRLGTENCGTCDFTATCLPDQTGCLATPPVTNASLSSIITTAEFPDRRFAYGFSGLRRAIYEIDDTGAATLIDTETNQTSSPSIQALGQSDQAAFWTYEDGTIRTRPVGGATTTLTRIADLCVSVAATASYVVCGLLDVTNTDERNSGVWRYPLNNPTAGELVAHRTGLVDVKTHGDTAYYTSPGGGPIGMFTVSTKAAIAVTSQAPPFVTATYGAIGNSIVVVGGATADARELWTIALDGSAAQRIAALDGIEVVGTGAAGVLVRSTSTPQRAGLLSLETRKVDTLIQDAGQTIASGTSRAGVFWFLGTPGPVLLKLTR